MGRQELLYTLSATVFAACLIAATNQGALGGARLYLYAYWLVRLLIECGLFIAFRSLIEAAGLPRRRIYSAFCAAFMLSLIPFVLAATAFDIVLGLPELGLASPGGDRSFLSEFFFEIIYLADDHLFLCLIVSLPRLLSILPWRSTLPAPLDMLEEDRVQAGNANLLPMLDKPLKGVLTRMEAQEHYVTISTTEEQRMILGRFSDMVAMLPPSLGMQVHRSHWVARAAVSKVFAENRNMKLRLYDGSVIPVSRRNRDAVKEQFDTGAPDGFTSSK